MDLFVITKDWIHENKTTRGGWNKPQIECLGLTWPPREGWIDLLEGVPIRASEANQFEKLRTYKKKGKNRHHRRKS